MKEIERVGPIANEDFASRFEHACLPVVIEGGARDVRAVERFSPDYLREKLGHVQLPWKLSTTHKHPNFREDSLAKMFAREEGTFAELLERITTGPVEERSRRLFTGDERFLMRRRNGQTTIDPELAPLLDDVEIPSLVPRDRLYTVWAWFSGAGVRTWLHYDNNACHNLNAQLTGEKECFLIDPNELQRVYPFLLGSGNPASNCSQVDVEAVDETRFPDFAAATQWHATLHAGDLLFIPAWWWHTFHHLGAFNSNLNFWWKPDQPVVNATANRQTLLDIVAGAGIAAKGDSPDAALLRKLDEAAVRRLSD